MRRVADIERRIAAIERAPQISGQGVQLVAQQQPSSVKVEHNYLRRAIATAKKEYEKKYK